MKINGIWSKVGGQKMKFSIVLDKKWMGKCPPYPTSTDAPETHNAIPVNKTTFLLPFVMILVLVLLHINSMNIARRMD